MKTNLIKRNVPNYHSSNKRIGGLIVILAVAVVLIVSALIVLPRIAPAAPYKAPQVVAIVPENDAMVGVGADPSKVFVKIRYSDNTEETKSLSELKSVGFDVSKPGDLKNVILDFGGFRQTVEYKVLPTEMELRYTAGNGGRIEGPTLQKVPAGGDASTVVAIPDEGYQFDHWSDGYLHAERTDKQVSSNNELRAVFTLKEYIVVFYYPDGTVGREQIVAHNSAATMIPDPTEQEMQKYGYRFIGWNISQENIKHIKADTYIYPLYEKYAADVTLEYTLGIEGEPLGTSDVKEYYPKQVESLIRIEANPERTFTGWKIKSYNGQWIPLNPEGTTILIEIGASDNPVLFSTSRTGTSNEYVLTFTPSEYTELIEIRAEFIYNSSTVTFTSMSRPAAPTVKIPMGTSIGSYFGAGNTGKFDSIPLESILGYTFKGWYVKNGAVDSEGKPVLITNDYTFTQPTDLIAYWEKNIYDVVFYAGESENISEDIVLHIYYQDSLAGEGSNSFPSIVPERTNYNFIGWYLMENGVVTDKVVDKTYKVEKEFTEIYPRFRVKQKNLNVSFEGSGSIKVRKAGAATSSNITGAYAMDIINDYVVEITPDVGYTISSVQVNEADPVSMTADYYEIAINKIITADYNIRVIFKLSEYDLTITNGSDSAVNSGSVSYQIISGQELITETKTDVTIPIKISDGVSKHIWINARNGYYISLIKIEGTAINNVPSKAVSYTLVLGSISDHINVEIMYEQFKYYPEIKNTDTSKGSITEKVFGPYTADDEPSFDVSANEGYYIKVLRINGTAIDPYGFSSNYRVDNIMLMGFGLSNVHNAAGDSELIKDKRITAYLLTVRNLKSDFSLEVEFERLYYNISVQTQGFGSVNIENTSVNYGETFSVTASTSSGFYVAAYSVNGGTPQTYTEHNSVQIITLSSVKEDKVVLVEYKRKTYSLTFTGEHVSLEYTENGITEETAFPKTLIRESAYSDYFVIRADEGYKIASVKVNGVNEDIAFNASKHNLKLDNISENYTIEVSTESLTYSVKYYIVGEGTADALSDTVQYNETYVLYITVADGKTLDLERIEFYGLNSKQPPKNKGMFEKTLDETVESQYELKVSGFYEDMEIYVPVLNKTENPGGDYFYSLKMYYDDTMGAVTVVNTNPEATDFDNIPAGTDITLRVTAVSDEYILKYLMVNGVRRELTNNEIILNSIQEDQEVYAVFDRRLFELTLSYNDKGIVTASNNLFNYGDIINLRIVASKGYEVTYFAIGGIPYNDHLILAAINANAEYTISASQTVSDLTVEVKFSPEKYTLNIFTNNGGSVNNETVNDIVVEYDQFFRLTIEADFNYFIESILVNGESVDPATLNNPQMNGSIQKYVIGTLEMYITGDTVIEVSFSPNIYRVSIADTANGTTLVNTEDTYPSNGVNLKLYAGDNLTLRMTAYSGYHIESVEINGVFIDGWQLDIDEPNNNRSIEYTIYDINENLYIKVNYALNHYDIEYSIRNGSVNFSRYDTVPSQYGNFSIYGYTPSTTVSNAYEEIEHGSDLRFMFAPVANKGYYVSVFTISWIDPDNRDNNQVTILNYTQEAATTGQYIYKNIRGNLRIEVEFKRKLFTFNSGVVTDQRGAPFASDGSLTVTFTNPYSGNTDVQLIDGKYEYGLSYTAFVNPGTGYTLTAFTVKIANDAIDRKSSVRSGRFSGEIRSDVEIIATYTIASYEIHLTGNEGGYMGIYDENNSPLWRRGEENQPGVFYTRSGRVEVLEDHILATYGTRLSFRIIPINEPNGYENGYLISSIIINNIRHTVTNADAIQHITLDVASKVNFAVTFALHQYNITFKYNEYGGVTKASPNIVVWGESSTISLTMYDGYLLTDVKINDNSDSEIFNAIKNKTQSSFTLSDIRTETEITFLYERKPYSISFKGGYEQTFTIKDNDYDSTTGVVINQNGDSPASHFSSERTGVPFTIGANIIAENGIVSGGGLSGARFKDSLTFYFLPVNGYRIASINITMKDSGLNDITLITNPQNLFVFDSANGYYYYTIANMTGDVSVTVNYTIKTYTVRMMVIGNGHSENIYTFISHHDDIVLNYTANYGYHLESLIINDKAVITDNRKVSENGLLVYKYTTSYGDTVLNVNDDFLNGKTEIDITARFEINFFAVKMFVNDKDIAGSDPDPTLSLTLANNSIYYGQNAKIVQTRSEGYSITGILFQNKEINPDTILDYSTTGTVNNLKAENLYFDVFGNVIDMLDYHSATNRTLYVKYYTEIDKHYSIKSTHLYETGLSPNSVPTVNGAPAFRLDVSYTDNIMENDALHDYFTRATFTMTIASAASNDYQFTGYQEYDVATDTWSYVKHGVNGIALSSEGRVLNYEIKGNRIFRAVVFRMYEVKLQIYPEYKYLSGSYSVDRFDMRYRPYATMTANAKFDPDKKPDITDTMLLLNDLDGVSDDGSYTYKIHCGATLMLKGTDTITSTNPTPAVGGINYYYITYNSQGVIQQQAANLETGQKIEEDKFVHAYFNNNVLLSFSLETEGGISDNEGGAVAYFKSGVSLNLSNNSLRVAANDKIRIEITPNANYRFDAILMKEALDELNEAGNRKFTDNWLTVTGSADGTTVIEYVTDGTGRITKVIMNLIVTENTIYKIRFWKLIKVTSGVSLFTDETQSSAIKDAFTPDFISASPDGIYDYGATVTYTLPTVNESNTWNLRSQFVGFFINGVNSYKRLANSFPSTYTATYVLAEDESIQNGVTIKIDTDNSFAVNFTAKYVPIYNLTFENEYLFSQDGNERYFDVGQITASIMAYSMDRAQYYQSSISILSKIEEEMRTDKSLQALGKINALSAYTDTETSPYNIFNDNYLTLNWASANLAIGQDYSFRAWQYYVYKNGEWQWVNIPYTDAQNPSNKATAKTFTFPVKVLTDASYFSDTAGTNNGYKYQASQYDVSGNYLNSVEIFTIRIRPLFQRVETITIDRVVYYTAEGVSDDSRESDNPARIKETGVLTGLFNYYSVITLDPAPQIGYDFLGWYEKNEEGIDQRINYTGELTSSIHRRLTGNNNNELQVRVVDTKIYYAKYIKVWDITIQTMNLSGTSNLLLESTPFIAYYGLPISVSGSTPVYPDQPLSNNSRLVSISVRAGNTIKFMLNTVGTQYDPTYDSHVEGIIRRTDNTTEKMTTEPINNSIESISSVEYNITADASKTIEIRFRTKGTLVIDNVYYGSTIKIPDNLAMALNIAGGLVTDASNNADSDNLTNGKIVLRNIPITGGASYDGVFGNSLNGMGNNFITAPGISLFGINYNGDEITSKYQTFKFYNTSDGSNDSITKLDLPFDRGLTSDAGNGTPGKPYLIRTLAHLKFIDIMYVGNNNSVAELNFKLTADISLYNNFTSPLCSQTQNGVGGFNGTFDGNNYSLYSLRLNKADNYVGIFARLRNATVKNLYVGGANVSVSGYNYTGYLAGYAENSTISYVNIIEDVNDKYIVGRNYVGGLIGYITTGTKVEYCSLNRVSVTGNAVSGSAANVIGGLIGGVGNNSLVTNCNTRTPYLYGGSATVSGTVTYAESVGGLVGLTEGTGENAVANSYSQNPILGGSNTSRATGGLVGKNTGGRTIFNSYVTGQGITINTPKSTSVFRTPSSVVEPYGGGIFIGYNGADSKVISCYLSGSATITLVGTIVGGFVGINMGEITNCNTGSYTFYTSRTTNEGGIFSAFAGYNNGKITNCTVSAARNTSFAASGYLYYITTDGSTSFPTGGDATSLNADEATLYLGGIAGYNAGSGIIDGCNVSGKLLINRRSNYTKANAMYIGGYAGYNHTAGNIRNCSGKINNASIMAHYHIRTVYNSGAALLQYWIGLYAGVNSPGGSAGSNNYLAVNAVGHAGPGEYVDRTKNWLGIYNNHAKNYMVALIRVNQADIGVTINRYTTQSIPGSLYSDSDWLTGYKVYNGNLRQVNFG